MYTVTQYIQQVFDILNWIANNLSLLTVIAPAVLSGLYVAPQKVIKKWFVKNERVIITFIGTASVVIMFAWSYLIHNYSTVPQVVALQGLALAFSTQPFYFIMIKPLMARIAVYSAQRTELKASLESAFIPPEGLPPYLQPDVPEPIGPVASDITPVAASKNETDFSN